MTTTRLDFTEGLRRLADFLDAHEDVPLPQQKRLQHTVLADYDAQGIGRLGDIAALLRSLHDDVTVGIDRPWPGNGKRHHAAEAHFGPVNYFAVYVEDPRRAAEIAQAVQRRLAAAATP